MSVDQNTKLVLELEAYHATRLTDQQAKDYVTILSTCESIEQMAKAIRQWKYLHGPTDRFPAPVDLVKLYYEARNQEWNRAKLKSPTLATLARRRHRNKDLALKTFALIQRMFEKNISHEEAVTEFGALEKEFPGIGWKETSENLQGWWAGEIERLPQRRVGIEASQPEA